MAAGMGTCNRGAESKEVHVVEYFQAVSMNSIDLNMLI